MRLSTILKALAVLIVAVIVGAIIVVMNIDFNQYKDLIAEKVKEATGGKGVDLVVDQVSAGVMNQNMEAAAVLGRIVNVGRLGGMKGEFNFDLHALKRIDYIGVTFRTRSAEEVRAIVAAARADLWPAIEAGKLSLPIDRTFPLAEAAEALAHMKANAHFGKIVLVV